MAHIQPEQTAAIGRGVTPPQSERVRSSLKNAEEASRHPGSLLAESDWLMSIKKPRKTSPALGSPFPGRDFLYTTNWNAHSIASAEERVFVRTHRNRTGSRLCAKSAVPLFQRSSVILVLAGQKGTRILQIMNERNDNELLRRSILHEQQLIAPDTLSVQALPHKLTSLMVHNQETRITLQLFHKFQNGLMQTTCRARLAQHVVEVRNRVFQAAQSGSGKANPKSHRLPGFPRGRSEHQPCRRALRRHSPLEPSCAGTRSWTTRGVHNPRAS